MKKKLETLPLATLQFICNRWNGSTPADKKQAVKLIVNWCRDYNLNYADLKSTYNLPD